MAVEALADLGCDVAEDEGLAHRLLALLRVRGGDHMSAVWAAHIVSTIV